MGVHFDSLGMLLSSHRITDYKMMVAPIMSQTCSSEDVKGKPHISCTEVPRNIVDAYPETS
ncbi:hypothetical protein SCLCIDRAFT_1208057 [Scleroderma citrinum Foug A]|uniref:Uncharacterized protein n=1 Tax=Scleroderma citrinum Foug A TaxID=1036808 RepID=A0A0C3EN54_9AGAM|nr:hypothetical protein SCLCIDRAFT_1208057 [Scleroderma citrinum Foug A]